MTRGPAFVLLLAATFLAGCGSGRPPVDGGPDVDAGLSSDTCADSPEWAGMCPLAVDAANERLGWLHWPVTSTVFRSSLCPPNARCSEPLAAEGWVVFTFWIGDPVMVRVGRADTDSGDPPEIVAGAPEPLPDWLLEEIAPAG